MRKALSRRLRGSLEGDSDHQANLDTVIAMGLTDSLGSVLWRLKYDSTTPSAEDFERAVTLLRQECNVPSEVAGLALTEWLDHACRRCKGQQTVQVADKVIDCPSCKGHPGLHRFSDRERANRMRVSYGQAKRWGSKISKVHGRLNAIDQTKGRQMSARLIDQTG